MPDSTLGCVFFYFFWGLLNLLCADNRSAVESETRGRRGVKGIDRAEGGNRVRKRKNQGVIMKRKKICNQEGK